jgi:CubicO group peptidase (beta-lactamase class C family)
MTARRRALGLLCVVAACAPKTPEPTPFNHQVDSLVMESMRDGKVPGLAVTIVRNDSVLHSKGYGFADLERQAPMTDSALAIMQLVDAGKVSLDTSITRYVRVMGAGGHTATPFADPRFAAITTRHLLTNGSGLPVGFSGHPYADGIDTSAGALERLVRDDMLPRTLDFAPGTGYAYSNRGFSLASLVVQDASGQSYEQYVAERIFTPLGMRHSTGEFWRGPAMGRAAGYREDVNGKPLPRDPAVSREWTGSGMLTSTTADVGRMLMALLREGRAADGTQILSPSGVAELLRGQYKGESELGGPTMYALGWEVNDMNGVPVVMKGGSVVSMGSLFLVLPQQEIGIAMVINLVDYGKVQLMQNLVKALQGAPTSPYQSAPARPTVPSTGFRVPPARLADIAGTYETRVGRMVVHTSGDTATARWENNDVRLEPASLGAFIVRSVLVEQEGAAMSFRPCGPSMCVWIRGDSSGVRLPRT